MAAPSLSFVLPTAPFVEVKRLGEVPANQLEVRTKERHLPASPVAPYPPSGNVEALPEIPLDVVAVFATLLVLTLFSESDCCLCEVAFIQLNVLDEQHTLPSSKGGLSSFIDLFICNRADVHNLCNRSFV